MKKIIGVDKWLFGKINQNGANDFFDLVMPFLRVPAFWLPFYLFLFVLLLLNFRKHSWPIMLLLGATASATDLISSRLIKPGFARLRPCNDPELSSSIRVLAEYCGQNGSFTSSHAANHFGIAMFLFIVLKPFWGNWCWMFFAWAFVVCYAQVYIGVHFPFDILGGAILGCVIGWFMAGIYQKYFSAKIHLAL